MRIFLTSKMLRVPLKLFYFKNENNSVLIITHNTKLLENLKVDYVHILVNGKIIKTGDYSLAKEIDKNGYSSYLK